MSSARLAVVILIAAGLNLDCVGGPSASTVTTPSVSQACTWPILADIDTNSGGLVDSGAAYWLDTFHVQNDLRIVLTGRFPDARYMSIGVYTSGTNLFTTNGVGSYLTDYQILPDAGSINPWQQSGPAGGKYTVTLRSDPTQGQANTLPLASTGTPDGSKGYLQYRVYLPAGGDFSKLVAPTVTLQQGGRSTNAAELRQTRRAFGNGTGRGNLEATIQCDRESSRHRGSAAVLSAQGSNDQFRLSERR
jgi:hypothetical protein